MTTIDRIDTLLSRHASLETKLEEEERRPHPDDAVIHDLKRKKLAIKDEIARLEKV
ncbi:MAG: YdcH family protein [Thalassobaculum sp.]|uniref:YdcH family protein n=1 Tax=Thalassobaculum sp. TaxID=2022740 RepID=UPI0032EDA4A8